ncbi:MAG: NACHT domain-containing protein [Chloroflexi bacterium]|nr:NACHT domain-containing protein [Chloroflexota bacterium]
MPDRYQFALALRALREVQAEIGQDPAPGLTIFPGLAETLDSAAPIPHESVLFGIAIDGLPLLLHLRDPRPGPILITGDRGSGKTDFLKMLILAANRLVPPGEMQFAVLTDFPSEWDDIFAPEHLSGVWPAYDPHSADLLNQLAWRVYTPSENQPTLLLLDGLESILQMDDNSQENFARILLNGPQALIWPVVTVNAEMAVKLPAWLAYFRTRIYGRISAPATAEELTPIPGAALNGLFPGSQFCMREKSHWLKFWLPSLH